MIDLLAVSSPIFAANFRAIGLTISILTMLAFVALFIRNVFEAKDELGSEIELAANRKPYLDDEELEGTKLDRSLTFALVLLGITSLIIPFYWLAEPGRQDGSVALREETFALRGERLYTGGAQCVNCHAAGGVGGGAPYVFQDADGQFLGNAIWTAPALNNVLLRYSPEEVTYILNFGRPGSPMAAWGTPGGGPLTTQQVEYLVAYLGTLQVQSVDVVDVNLTEDPSVEAAAEALRNEARAEVQRSLDAGEFDSSGEAVFNLGLFSGFKAGSLSCGRCHTAGWSLGPETVPEILAEGNAACGGGDPSGIGFSLCGGITERFPDDTWLSPDGGWLSPGQAPRSTDGQIIGQDDKNNPVIYFELDGTRISELSNEGRPVIPEDEKEFDDEGNEVVPEYLTEIYEILDDGDLADCSFVSKLWEPEGSAADAYPYDGTDFVFVADDSADGFVDPPELTAADLSGTVVELSGGRLGGSCDVVEMPPRTSQANYNFIYNGADAGEGYGRGGQSHQGMMPAFGKTLPPDLIHEVVNYIRGLE